MSSRFFVFIGLAMLAFPIFASTAMSAGSTASASMPAPTAAPASENYDGKDAVPTKKYSGNVCEITGVVAKLENVERSPWSDGTPSTLSIFETDIWVTVNDRKPHYKNAPADSLCNRGAKGEIAAYKLCSPTKVLKGDRIHATEGLHTGSTRSVGCLFDLVVLPPPEGVKKKT
jgi:hypothetical protein